MNVEAISPEQPSPQQADAVGKRVLEALQPDRFVDYFKAYAVRHDMQFNVDTVTPEQRPMLAEGVRLFAQTSALAANKAETQARISALKGRAPHTPKPLAKLHDEQRIKIHLKEFYETFASSLNGSEQEGMAARRRKEVQHDSEVTRSYWFKPEVITVNNLSLQFRSQGNLVAHAACEELLAAYGRDLLPFKRAGS